MARKFTRRQAIMVGAATAVVVGGAIVGEVLLPKTPKQPTPTTSGSSASSQTSPSTSQGGQTSAGSSVSSSTTTSATQTTASGSFSTQSADYQFFIQPYLSNIERLRSWLMSPFDASAEKAGYDSSYGMVRGGYWSGGFQNGFVLIDTQLLLARTLDFQNAQNGISTNIEGNLRDWLSRSFDDPLTGDTAVYNGQDRREILLGKTLSAVNGTTGQVYYVPGHTLTDPNPITTALPTTPVSGTVPLNEFAPLICLAYLQGNTSDAKTMFDQVTAAWVSTPGTGLGGSTGGYFGGAFDNANGGKCNHTRNLGYWLCAARATGFWSLNKDNTDTAQQVLNEIWAHQLSSGGILVNYLDCGSQTKDTGESAGVTLLSTDPRLPSWFGH